MGNQLQRHLMTGRGFSKCRSSLHWSCARMFLEINVALQASASVPTAMNNESLEIHA